MDTNAAYTASVNETNATNTPLGFPFTDNFLSLNQWITSGQWALTTNTAYNGPDSLSSSPGGNYTANGDDNAQTSLDLRLAKWPVLRFWDQYAVTPSSRAAVQVGGVSMYIVNGTQSNWEPEAIDLSWWAGSDNVPVEFRLRRWNNEQAAGWWIDDVSVTEQTPVPLSYPFFDSFEQGLGNWLPANWHVVTGSVEDGTNSVYSVVTDDGNVARQQPMLSLAGWVSLTNAVNPQLVFWYQGTSCGDFHVQACTLGSGWTTIWTDPYCQGYGWTRAQVSLAGYVNQSIRLNFYISDTRPIWIDKVGIGGIMPGAPTLAAPADNAYVTPLRPTLVVTNAVHAENFALTYQFEVYSDAGLSNLVAQVPLVAAGALTTSWPLDINLANNAEYWWRCRAWYSTNAGPWMPTATFHVDQGDNPPGAPALISPLNGTELTSTNSLLTWYPGNDPDPDDYINAYRVQVDATSAFASPLIDTLVPMSGPLPQEPWVTVSVPVGDLAGVASLVPGGTYYWRVQSQDEQSFVSAWSAGVWSFIYLQRLGPALTPATITAVRPSGKTALQLSWTGSTNTIFVEFSPSLVPPVVWTNLVGPLTGPPALVPAFTNAPTGFYRLRSQ